ncbi:MAG: hypothetical protein NC453_15415 [Muribaculum sp.]|nr:hypothetical protein [Muribaculum sp.]
MRLIFNHIISVIALFVFVSCGHTNNDESQSIERQNIEAFEETQFKYKEQKRNDYLEKFNVDKAKKWIGHHYRNQMRIDSIWYESNASAKLKIISAELSYLNFPNTLLSDCNNYVTFVVEGQQDDYTIKYGITLEPRGESYSILREHILPSDF